MAKNKATEDTIFMGKFYPAGSELPEEHEELSKPKTSRMGGNYANQLAAMTAAGGRPSQENRPGMSGSGKPQTADIVDDLGHVTQPQEGEGEEKKGSSKKEEKESGSGKGK